MSEKISVEKITEGSWRHNFLCWAVCNLIADEAVARKVVDHNLKEYEFEVKINGVEVKFSELLKLLEEAFDKSVNVTACKLLQDKLGNLSNLVEEITRKAMDIAKTELDIGEYDLEG